ncbi:MULTISPECIES: hypothetical protein [Cyanophyceae]|uniref:hypothetical protein n=1 Tax=Cyanophyceae TaxID=3028117 RepID=UPI001686F2F6|nr:MULTISPECIES: hypothetical protein [Cyanophyceae]MBD1914605.1 hypothetical protein [Phormidium sp. FACHB-77]MBD2030329.1 hypothetical protein [Phormidium sp. FACHB-322]MBD2049874.1 hypothetical protein [Leptolyngbya sp. FACHB-60]
MNRIDQAVEQANRGLNRIEIVQRGRKLALRGSLPKRPGEGRGNKQTTISLGVFANPDGVKVATAKAQRLESDLNMERFTWAEWEKGENSAGGKSAAAWDKEYGAVKAESVKTSTYRTNYQERLESLPDKPLTE